MASVPSQNGTSHCIRHGQNHETEGVVKAGAGLEGSTVQDLAGMGTGNSLPLVAVPYTYTKKNPNKLYMTALLMEAGHGVH